jgi:dipeptidyl aminopeptidase/acylaminoacyl peptidase
VSADGKSTVIFDQREGTAPDYALYVRPTDGSLPTPIGKGSGAWIAPDGASVLVRRGVAETTTLALVPAAGGEERSVSIGGLKVYDARWSRKGEVFVLAGTGREPARLWRVSPGKAPETAGPILPAGFGYADLADPEGREVLVGDAERWLYRADLIDATRPLRKTAARLGKDDQLTPIGHSADGRWIYVSCAPEKLWTPRRTRPLLVDRIDLETGKREPFGKDGLPPAQEGVTWRGVSDDGRTFLGGLFLHSSRLFLVEGPR